MIGAWLAHLIVGGEKHRRPADEAIGQRVQEALLCARTGVTPDGLPMRSYGQKFRTLVFLAQQALVQFLGAK